MDNAKASSNHKQTVCWKLFVTSLFELIVQSPESPRVLAIYFKCYRVQWVFSTWKVGAATPLVVGLLTGLMKSRSNLMDDQ